MIFSCYFALCSEVKLLFCFDWNVMELSGNFAVWQGIFCGQMPFAFVTDNKLQGLNKKHT